MDRFACRTEIGALSQMVCAVASVSSISFSGAQSLFTMPQSSACCALNGLPVRMISLARRKPTARGRNWVPPPPGMMPSVISVRAKRAVVARVGEVAGQRDLAAAAERRAVDRGDHGDRAVHEASVMRSKIACCAQPLLVGHAVAFFQVAAGAERLVAGAGQHHAAIVGVGAAGARTGRACRGRPGWRSRCAPRAG